MKLEEFWIGGLRKAAVDGDVGRGSLMAGQSVGLVKKVEPVADVIADLIDSALAEIRKHRKTFADHG
jgi:enoyl-[acyl-carrier protein] reductase II